MANPAAQAVSQSHRRFSRIETGIRAAGGTRGKRAETGWRFVPGSAAFSSGQKVLFAGMGHHNFTQAGNRFGLLRPDERPASYGAKPDAGSHYCSADSGGVG